MLFKPEPVSFDLPNGELQYVPLLFSEEESASIFQQLINQTPWQQDPILIFGKFRNQPRLTSLYGNDGKPHGYSGIVMQPNKWTPLLTAIKERVQDYVGETFTTVLLNLYRTGTDSNGWHADNERELGRNPTIASVSFGATRTFHLKHVNDLHKKISIELETGSLLVMSGEMQHYWKHQIPKTTKFVNPRINLTFRRLL